MSDVIGTPMDTAPPTTIGGKPTKNYYTGLATNLDEINRRLAAPIPPVTALGTPATGGALTLSGALSAASVATAEADVRHGARSLLIHASSILPSIPNTSPSSNNMFSYSGGAVNHPGSSNSATAGMPINLLIGDRITALGVYVTGNVGGTWTAKLFKITNTGTTTQIGSTMTVAALATDQTLTISGLSETCVDATFYYVEWTANTIGLAGARIYGAKVIYDRP